MSHGTLHKLMRMRNCFFLQKLIVEITIGYSMHLNLKRLREYELSTSKCKFDQKFDCRTRKLFEGIQCFLEKTDVFRNHSSLTRRLPIFS